MANKKVLSIKSIDEGRWQDTQGCFCSPCCLMSPRSNTKIMGGTGDQRATIDDCTRSRMSCATQTKWMAPFKMTSEVSKEVSVVAACAFCLDPAGATIAEWEGNRKKPFSSLRLLPRVLFERELQFLFYVGCGMRLGKHAEMLVGYKRVGYVLSTLSSSKNYQIIFACLIKYVVVTTLFLHPPKEEVTSVMKTETALYMHT